MKTGMITLVLLTAAGVAMAAGGQGAAGPAGQSTLPPTGQSAVAPTADEALGKQVRHELVLYPHYTIFDDVSFQVNHGQVILTGAVTEPYKKSELAKIVQSVPGVESVNNQLEVLPASYTDNQLRWQLARAIYRDPSLSRYGLNALPSIHIIVDNGHVTLTGVVATDFDKQVAGVRASTVGLSFGPIKNELRVEHPSKKS